MRSRRVATLAVALCLVMPWSGHALASGGTGDSGGGATTTTIVESEPPVPGAGQKPEVGPLISSVRSAGLGTYWWLVGFGGLQLVGLAVVTRRARNRTRLAEARVSS